MAEPSVNVLSLPIVWGDVSDLPVLAANQFAAQFGHVTETSADELILTVGFLAPPLVLGDDEDRRTAYANLGSVVVRPITRISMTRARLKELSDLLLRMLEKQDIRSLAVEVGNDDAAGT